MSVLVIFVGCDIKVGSLCSTTCVHSLRLRVLLRHKRCCGESPKLQLCFNTKQCRSTSNECGTSSHANITSLNILDYFIFFALIGKLKVFVIKLKGGISVVSHVKLHLVAYRCRYCGLYFLIKVEIGLTLSRDR